MKLPERRRPCDLWLWDGTSTYEGVLILWKEPRIVARVRRVLAVPASMLGRPGSSPTLVLHRLLAERPLLACVSGIEGEGPFMAEITSVQRSSDADFNLMIGATLRAAEAGFLDSFRLEEAPAMFRRIAG